VSSGCPDDDSLLANDGGVELQADSGPGGHGKESDGGEIDAGFDAPDAGSGDQDAGQPQDRCDFPENPSMLVPCEGDEDFCEPVVESQYDPRGDLLATWSHVDGDDFVIQLRTLAAPFRGIPDFTTLVIIVDTDEPNQPGDGPAAIFDPNHLVSGDFVFFLIQQNGDLVPYPPTPDHGKHPFDRPETFEVECAFGLGTTTGLVELRLPLEILGEVPRYAVSLIIPDDVPPTSDVSWLSTPNALFSRGGRANDALDIVNICTIECPSP